MKEEVTQSQRRGVIPSELLPGATSLRGGKGTMVKGEATARRRFPITAAGRSLAQIDAEELAASSREIARQEDIERKRQARIRRVRARWKARFVMPPPVVSAAARLMARRG